MHPKIIFLLAFVGMLLLTVVTALPTAQVNIVKSQYVCTKVGNLEHPAACKLFIHCDGNGDGTVHHCEDGTAWNRRQEMCDSDSYRLCYPGDMPKEERLHLTKALDNEPLKFLGRDDDDASFSSSTSSASITLHKTLRKYQYARIKKTNPTAGSSPIMHPIQKPAPWGSNELRKRQVSAPIGTLNPNISDTQPCTIGQVANVPNPKDCSKYTFCMNGYGQNFICPTGMKFDYVTGSCMSMATGKVHCYRLPVPFKWWTHGPGPKPTST